MVENLENNNEKLSEKNKIPKTCEFYETIKYQNPNGSFGEIYLALNPGELLMEKKGGDLKKIQFHSFSDLAEKAGKSLDELLGENRSNFLKILKEKFGILILNRLFEEEKINDPSSKIETDIIKKNEKTYDGDETYKGWERLRPPIEIYNLCVKYKIPFEFVFIPMIESQYKNTAISHTGCKGAWQFDSQTAKDYGLIKDGKDYREDYLKSSEAGIKYCRTLYHNFTKYLKEKKFDISIDNCFKWATLSYNVGLSKTKLICEYFGGDFEKMLKTFEGKEINKYKEFREKYKNYLTITINNRKKERTLTNVLSNLDLINKQISKDKKLSPIKKEDLPFLDFVKFFVEKNSQLGFPHFDKISNEITQYVPRLFTMRNLIKSYESKKIEFVDYPKDGKVQFRKQGKNLNLYTNNKGKILYKFDGETEKRTKPFYSETKFPIVLGQILDEYFGQDRKKFPNISRNIYKKLSLIPNQVKFELKEDKKSNNSFIIKGTNNIRAEFFVSGEGIYINYSDYKIPKDFIDFEKKTFLSESEFCEKILPKILDEISNFQNREKVPALGREIYKKIRKIYSEKINIH